MQTTIAFDVYGTLVNPAGMTEHLKPHLGEQAEAVSALWRQKQVEYAFRRGLMQRYADFGVCTRQALAFAFQAAGRELEASVAEALMERYLSLPAFEDARDALASLQGRYRLFAFSNGTVSAVEQVLGNAGLLDSLSGVVSVDELRTFKPNPAVYTYARRATGADTGPLWLVSGNAWDVIGARSAGLEAAWVQRDSATVFDPWGIEPSLVVGDLRELVEKLPVAG